MRLLKEQYAPIFRGNYYVPNRGYKINNYEIAYCQNNKEWLVFKEGMEIGKPTDFFINCRINLILKPLYYEKI
jgi:hypothetical protein